VSTSMAVAFGWLGFVVLCLLLVWIVVRARQ
jgi:hypothetical protein